MCVFMGLLDTGRMIWRGEGIEHISSSTFDHSWMFNQDIMFLQVVKGRGCQRHKKHWAAPRRWKDWNICLVIIRHQRSVKRSHTRELLTEQQELSSFCRKMVPGGSRKMGWSLATCSASSKLRSKSKVTKLTKGRLNSKWLTSGVGGTWTKTSHKLIFLVYKAGQYAMTSVMWGFCLFSSSSILGIEKAPWTNVKELSGWSMAGTSTLSHEEDPDELISASYPGKICYPSFVCCFCFWFFFL